MPNRIRELRVSYNLTQNELAKKVGLNQSAIGKYEREELEPNLETLKKLSILFECSIDYIIGFSDDFGNVTVYQNTDNLNALSADEQRLIDTLRKNPPYNTTDWLALYAELPLYMQEKIFAELKGMHLGYKAAKAKNAK